MFDSENPALYAIFALIVLALVGGLVWWFFLKGKTKDKYDEDTEEYDSEDYSEEDSEDYEDEDEDELDDEEYEDEEAYEEDTYDDAAAM